MMTDGAEIEKNPCLFATESRSAIHRSDAAVFSLWPLNWTQTVFFYYSWVFFRLFNWIVKTQLCLIRSNDQDLGPNRAGFERGSQAELELKAPSGCVWSEQLRGSEVKWTGKQKKKMELLAEAVAKVGDLVTGALNFFTDFFLTPPLTATLQYLEAAELKTLKGGRFFFHNLILQFTLSYNISYFYA